LERKIGTVTNVALHQTRLLRGYLHRQGDDSHGQPVDLDRIVVQARIQKEMRRFDFVEEEEWFDENLRTRASSG